MRRESWDSDRSQLRARLLEQFRTSYRFPLRATFKGYVVRERVLKIPRLAAHVAGQRTEGESQFLELAPAKYRQEAYSLVGGVLVPHDRRLQPGSVLEVTVDILDPTGYRLYPPGLLSELVSCNVVVGVEA
ncbi:MAG TPA: hypothetical protein VGR28_09290 [Candidatus Thermoplasmatota archaeon]|nr:hypothetical protein [Candidatus Thermoplasmatota archaeon]